jgi:hypothetical protein
MPRKRGRKLRYGLDVLAVVLNMGTVAALFYLPYLVGWI